jgi:hypothetical protein
MRPRQLTALAAGALTLSLLGPTNAQADDPELVPGPSLTEPEATAAPEDASEVLDEAEEVFEHRSRTEARELLAEGGADATMALNQLMRVYDDLTPAEQRSADALLARPTDDGGDDLGDSIVVEYENGEETPVCGEVICVHYASGPDEDAPSADDVDPVNGIPDAVDHALTTAEEVHDTYVTAGYRRPDGDNTKGDGDDLVDIYLADIGDNGLYGYCTDDGDATGRHRPAYCVIDEDFVEFDNLPQEDRQVTLAHEYFHAVQYAYDWREDPWLMEATAAWVEDELYDDVDDNRQYLVDSQMRKPYIPLDVFGAGSNHYGNWIFFRYLTERWPGTGPTGDLPVLMLHLWERLGSRAGQPNQYSTQGVQSVLAAKNTNFTSVYGQFADANRRPDATYDEGEFYNAAPPERTWRLTKSRRSTPAFAVELPHLTNMPLRYRPGSDLTQSDWRLRLKVDLPAKVTSPVARVARYLDNGNVQTSTVRFKKNGASTKTVGFSAANTDYVELVIVNASRRMRNCRPRFTEYACGGFPRDDGARTVFSASIFRS